MFEYCTGPLLEGGFKDYYKNYLVMNKDVPDQRKEFEAKMDEYLKKAVASWEKTILI